MNIGSIGSTSAITPIDTSTSAAATATPSCGGSDGARISNQAKLLASLKELAQKDPAKFKEVTQKISDELKSAASSATGDQAAGLTKLSNAFAQASASGDVSALQPKAPPSGAAGGGHHHGHHGGGGGGGAASLLSTALDQVQQALDSTTATTST